MGEQQRDFFSKAQFSSSALNYFFETPSLNEYSLRRSVRGTVRKSRRNSSNLRFELSLLLVYMHFMLL